MDEPERTDEALLVAAASGDGDAFAAFYSRHVDAVTGFFYRRTACPHTSADLAAETFAQALSAVHRFRPAPSAGSKWLFGIAANLYRRWCRRGRIASRHRRRLGIETPVLSHDDVEHIERLVDFEPLAGALEAALEALSPSVRDAVMLRIADDLPYEDVATRLGCSVATARVRVSRGLASLTAQVGTS